jgi:hypothetical protein
MNDAFGDKPLRRERNNRALEVASHHPPEEHEIEQLGLARVSERDERQRTALMEGQHRDTKNGQREVGKVEPSRGWDPK